MQKLWTDVQTDVIWINGLHMRSLHITFFPKIYRNLLKVVEVWEVSHCSTLNRVESNILITVLLASRASKFTFEVSSNSLKSIDACSLKHFTLTSSKLRSRFDVQHHFYCDVIHLYQTENNLWKRLFNLSVFVRFDWWFSTCSFYVTTEIKLWLSPPFHLDLGSVLPGGVSKMAA